jgi:hypothetical protein
VLSTTVSCTDDGQYVVTLSVSDGTGPEVTDSFTLTVTNAAPAVTITSPVGGAVFGVGELVVVSASVVDAGSNDSLSCSLDFGDGTVVAGTLAAGVCSGSHTYGGPFTGEITVTASDDEGALDSDSVSITVPNRAPTADDQSVSTNEDTQVSVTLTGSDPDADPLTFTLLTAPSHGTVSCTPAGGCTYIPDPDFSGTDSFTFRAFDGALGDTGTVSVTVLPIDDQPSVEAGADRSVVEGASVAVSGSAADPDGDALTTSWSAVPELDVDAGGVCTFAAPGVLSTTVSCTDDGQYVVTLSVSDGTGAVVAESFTLTVTNAAPAVTITSPAGGAVFQIGTPVVLSASFTDAGSNDTHTCSINWGDGVTTPGACSGSHSYGGMFGGLITVTVTDDDAAVGSATVGISVVPASGGKKVTGGGTFDMGVAGHSFGLIAAPIGTALRGQLQLQTPGHRFHGDTVTSLVVNGTTATWSGTGRWDGVSGARFTVTVTDAGPRRSGKNPPDTISIVVRDAAGAVLFTTNGPKDATTGNITIHK